ncbi:cytochrome P450 [Streptomyces montanus]|uniref:Cytochrome P450 n=1 Tax=Streptomyces montanus TaxID=2580423 RepID=A0A5R9FIL9_9ACTN|nr:cytochrome P450 [Streptomyces montanus]TLS41940.1 cytochrome P450 [Streptomyces montanus]
MERITSGPGDGPTLESLPKKPLLTPEFDADPAGVYERLRRQYGPVAPVELMGVPVWLVLGYREVLEVLRNESVWRRDVRHWRARAQGLLPPDWPLLAGYEVRQTMFMDDEEHRRARQTHNSALHPFQDGNTPQGWELRTAVAQYTDELVGTLGAESGPFGIADLCAQYTRPLLLMVTTKLFGFRGDLGDELVMDLWRMLDGGPDAGPATGRALAAMTQVAALRRERPGDDLTSHMLLADPGLSDEQLGRELFMNAVYLNDITNTMVLNTLLEVLLGNMAVRRTLSTGQLEETLNRAVLINPPTANLPFRFAARDVRLGNFRVRAGDVAMPSAAAAHRDMLSTGSSHIADSVNSTRAHLGWGAGHHQCPGAARELGSMIVTTAVGRFFEHFDWAELAVPEYRLLWRSGPMVRGLRQLPVRYELAATSTARQPIPADRKRDGAEGVEARQATDSQTGGLLSALRRLMPGGR